MTDYLTKYIEETIKVPQDRAHLIREKVEEHSGDSARSPMGSIPKVFTECEIQGPQETLLLCFYTLDIITSRMGLGMDMNQLKIENRKKTLSASFGLTDDRSQEVIESVRKAIEQNSVIEEPTYGYMYYAMSENRTTRQKAKVDKVAVIRQTLKDLQPETINEMVFICYITGLEVGQAQAL